LKEKTDLIGNINRIDSYTGLWISSQIVKHDNSFGTSYLRKVSKRIYIIFEFHRKNICCL